jgi:hypothetical protein
MAAEGFVRFLPPRSFEGLVSFDGDLEILEIKIVE